MFFKKIKNVISSTRSIRRVSFKQSKFKFKPLTLQLSNSSGRNNTGSITIRHRGGRGRIKLLRLDFFRNIVAKPGLLVNTIRLSTIRPLAGLVKQSTGGLSYIIIPFGLIPGWRPKNILSNWYSHSKLNVGTMAPLSLFKQGDTFFGLIFSNGQRSYWARAAGTCSQILYLAESGDFFSIRTPAGISININLQARAVLGRNSNIKAKFSIWGNAGRKRLSGWRPTVRGVAMNPVDHPHGGRTKTSQPELSPWGWVAKHNY